MQLKNWVARLVVKHPFFYSVHKELALREPTQVALGTIYGPKFHGEHMVPTTLEAHNIFMWSMIEKPFNFYLITSNGKSKFIFYIYALKTF
jgi:hypothetical protein